MKVIKDLQTELKSKIWKIKKITSSIDEARGLEASA